MYNSITEINLGATIKQFVCELRSKTKYREIITACDPIMRPYIRELERRQEHLDGSPSKKPRFIRTLSRILQYGQ